MRNPKKAGTFSQLLISHENVPAFLHINSVSSSRFFLYSEDFLLFQELSLYKCLQLFQVLLRNAAEGYLLFLIYPIVIFSSVRRGTAR